MNAILLKALVDQQNQQIQKDKYARTFNELESMYRKGMENAYGLESADDFKSEGSLGRGADVVTSRFLGILACGDDYVYSDTDSIKVRNYEKHLDYIESYNNLVSEKLKAASEYHRIPMEDFSPLNRKGEPKPIGIWDFEGVYNTFKTLGAKRYMTEKDGEYSLTVAGVNKKSAMEYLEKFGNPFAAFDDHMIVPKEYSGRLILDYCGDAACCGEVEDYLGNVGEYSELSYVHMEPTTYELTFSVDYKLFTDMLMEVYDDSW